MMGALTKFSKMIYNKITINNDIVLESNIEVNTFICNLNRYCIKFNMTYFGENFLILTAKEDINDEVEWFDDENTVNLFKDWDQMGEIKLIALSVIGDTILCLKNFAMQESYLENLEWMEQHLLKSMKK